MNRSIIGETYTVVGQLLDNANHTFGEYPILTDADEVWRGHHGKDGPARIERRNSARKTIEVWRNGEWNPVSA